MRPKAYLTRATIIGGSLTFVAAAAAFACASLKVAETSAG
jgi:hypothetical protein